jgi:thioredoxin reductase (NADPH)
LEKRRCTLDTHYDVIILGSGPAGLTAGIYTGRARLRTLILGERPGGKPLMYEHIGNYPGFPDGVTGAQLMMGMLKQVGDLGVDRVPGNADDISLECGATLVTIEFRTDGLLVGMGQEPNSALVPGTGGSGQRGFRRQGPHGNLLRRGLPCVVRDSKAAVADRDGGRRRGRGG